MILIAIILALLGWLVGIVINHAADILPTRQPVWQRLKCGECETPYNYGQWSALLAWATGQTQCTRCGSSRATLARSVSIEVSTPLFFVFLGWRFGISAYLGLVLIYTAVLILITVTDLEHRLIFNVVTIPSIVLAIGAALLMSGINWRLALLGGAIGLVITYIIWLLGVLFYGQGAFGVGDITLSTFLGFILGFPHIILSLIMGVFLGGIVAFLLVITRLSKRTAYIPYGPFLTITGWIMLVWGNQIWDYYF